MRRSPPPGDPGHAEELAGSRTGSTLPGGFPAWLVIGYRELHQVTSDGEL
ncbi:cytochrome P450, partial [Streptomyces sp. 900116325]